MAEAIKCRTVQVRQSQGVWCCLCTSIFSKAQTQQRWSMLHLHIQFRTFPAYSCCHFEEEQPNYKLCLLSLPHKQNRRSRFLPVFLCPLSVQRIWCIAGASIMLWMFLWRMALTISHMQLCSSLWWASWLKFTSRQLWSSRAVSHLNNFLLLQCMHVRVEKLACWLMCVVSGLICVYTSMNMLQFVAWCWLARQVTHLLCISFFAYHFLKDNDMLTSFIKANGRPEPSKQQWQLSNHTAMP